MDNGGLGEGMLPLAAAAARGGLLAPNAQIVPKRLRVFCTLVELRGCGDAHDGAELAPSSLCGVSLAPWLAYRTRRSYAAVDLAAAEYCALSEEWLLLEAELGAPPPDGGTVAVPLHADGTLNAIVWTWEADLDDSGSPDAMLSNAHHAPRTHWRQAAQLFEAGRTVCAGETAVVRFATGGGRALSFELEAAAARRRAPPARFRPHLLRQQPAVDAATAVAPARSVTPPPPRPPRGLSTRRSAERMRFARRRTRCAPALAAPVAADAEWLADLERADGTRAVKEFGVEPTSTADALALSEAVLEIAAQPAAYGVDPADAAQAVRLYFAG